MQPREKLWVVRAGDGKTVAEIVTRAGEPSSAIVEGRVFVDKFRATRGDQPVRAGQAVRIGRGPERTAEARAAIPILFEQDGLVACVKPAGLPTVPDHDGAAHALVSIVAGQLRTTVDRLRVTSRLDREVSGVVVFALDPVAEERLREARARGDYRRRYVALAAGGDRLDASGVWAHAIGRGDDPRLRQVGGEDAKPAATRWAKVAMTAAVMGVPAVALLAVDPVTGRTHQIRVHATAARAPLVGDGDYGGATRLSFPNGRIVAPSRIALHAARVVVPGRTGPIEAIAPIPAELRELWLALGGNAEAWNGALACETPPEGP